MNDEEDVTAQLLRLAGRPPEPPAARAARVREAVHREWRAATRRRVLVRAIASGAVVAGLAASVALLVNVRRPEPVTPAAQQVIAVGQRIEGQPLVVHAPRAARERQLLTPSTSIYLDDVIETDAESRVALRSSDGSSVRIDRQSSVRFLAPAVIEVRRGAVYIATATGSKGFEVRTTFGAVRDLGTQFEVRVTEVSLQLRVRIGRVELRRGSATTAASTGTETTVTSDGIAVRHVPPFGAEWAWAAEVAPTMVIESQPLRTFLDYVAAEEGWTIKYADAGVRETASRAILHGSVEGLTAEDALRVVLATSGLRYTIAEGTMLVSRAGGTR
jgi:ferric-dicitrate binding protein FerR (iron transport regulator)